MPLITKQDILDKIQTAGSDFKDTSIDESISIAETRYMNIKDLESLPETVSDTDKKAIVLLAIIELATEVNLFWRGQESNTGVIKVNSLTKDVERLLNISAPTKVMVGRNPYITNGN